MIEIVSRDMIRAKARAAARAGRSRDSHNMNPHAPALHDWLIAYDQERDLMKQERVIPAQTGMTEPA